MIKDKLNTMYLPQIWRSWQAIRKLWWVQVLYLLVLLGSYAFFAYVLSCIWLVESPSLLQIFLIAIGSFLGVTAIIVSVFDCILLCCRRSARVQTFIVEPLVVPLPLSQSNPMLVPRKPIGRGATAEKIESKVGPQEEKHVFTYEP